jgi:ATP-binding cassette subfamily B protein
MVQDQTSTPDQEDTKPTAIFKYLWPGVRARWPQLILAVISTICGVILRLLEPWPLQLVLDHVVGGLSLPLVFSAPVNRLALAMDSGDSIALLTLCAISLVIMAIARAAMDFHRTVAFSYIGNAIISDLRSKLFSHLQTLSLDFHSRTRSGDLTVRLTSDVNMLKDVTVSAALPLISSALLLVGMLVVMLWINLQLGLVILLAFPFFAWMTIRSSRKIHQSARKQRRREGVLASAAAESLSAVRSLQAQGIESSVCSTFSKANKKSHQEGARTSRLMAGLERSVDVQIALVTAIILWIGARSVLNGHLTAGELVVYLAYLKRGFKPLQDFAKYTGRFSKAIAAGERIAELLQKEPEIVDSPHAIDAPRIRGSIALDDVWFGFQRSIGDPKPANGSLYENFSLYIEAGSKLAVVGPSGVGKSTLFSLLLRLRDPDRGSILIDGTNICNWKLHTLRQQMSVILQENSIFATTVAENIGMFCPAASRADIIAAAKTACAHEFIEQMADGYDTLVGERGANLSCGQIQRIAIARAALKDSPILLLDEPTSNLDARNRALVLSALHRVAALRTTLIITHDLDVAQQCDRVLFLGKKHEIAYGTHASLLASSSSYARLWESSPLHEKQLKYTVETPL